MITATVTSPTPVERAWIGELVDATDPCRYLFTVLNLPDGGARTYYAWTAGGQQVGDDIDHLAAAQGRDVYDWVEFHSRYETRIDRGRHYVLSVDLRPLYEDLRHGVPGADVDRRAGLGGFAAYMVAAGAQPGHHIDPDRRVPWIGFGPRLLGTR